VLHCLTPLTWADWQSHRCEFRCSGDDITKIPTYSEDVRKRCAIAKACPFAPDKLYGDNNTRSCVTSCITNSTYTEWADNITRTCLPQCLNYTYPDAFQTRYFGDLSSNFPICVITCSESPRTFGENKTNLCVK
jgi:hypothetical protein